MAIKNKLKEILEERGIKQTWLAERCNIHRGTMNNIIANKYNTSLEVAFKIAKALNLKVDDVFEFADDES